MSEIRFDGDGAVTQDSTHLCDATCPFHSGRCNRRCRAFVSIDGREWCGIIDILTFTAGLSEGIRRNRDGR